MEIEPTVENNTKFGNYSQVQNYIQNFYQNKDPKHH